MTIKALKESIEKWRQIERGEMPDFGGENCALCELHLDSGCTGCPVSRHTGRAYCRNTPYALFYENCQVEYDEKGEWLGNYPTTPEAFTAARDERLFLAKVLRNMQRKKRVRR